MSRPARFIGLPKRGMFLPACHQLSPARRRARVATGTMIGLLVFIVIVAYGALLLMRQRGAAGRAGMAATSADRHPAGADDAWFDEVAAESGIGFKHVSALEHRFLFPEIMSGGACLFDYDDDGGLDLYFVQGGDLDATRPDRPGNALYRNRGDGTFEDVTPSAGVGDTGYGMGCACGDVDNDGDVDLYVTNVGPNVLYRNNGDGTFADITVTAGVGDPAWSSSAAFVDYDRDGRLDLFVVNYIRWSMASDIECFAGSGARDYCSPLSYNAPAPSTLYRNASDSTGVRFEDVSEPSGIRAAFGNGLGVACADVDGDGWIDIYVANDGAPKQLWRNNRDGTFTDQALLAGCAVNRQGESQAGMGVAFADPDNDGDWDLFVSHLRAEYNTFYGNQRGLFTDLSAEIGLAGPSIEFTGFGLGFADFDHDARLDVFIANGRVRQHDTPLDKVDVYAEPDLLFAGRNDAGRTAFVEMLPRGGTHPVRVRTGRAAAFGDLDNDGDTDIVVINRDAGIDLLRNRVGARGHWIMFRVLNEHGSDAINAVVRVETGGTVQYRMVQPAYSYCASNDPRVHFGLGRAAAVDRVEITWPDGARRVLGPSTADRTHVIRWNGGD